MLSVLKVHPINFIKAMSMALELTHTGISNHHCRTAIIAKAIAQELKLPHQELQTLIYASLLHDIGAASNWDEKHNIIHNDSAPMIFNHAEEGYKILKSSPFLNEIATPIRHHHDRYAGENPSGLKGEDIPLLSRIIHIADRIEVMVDNSIHIFTQRQEIISYLEGSALFDPNLVNVVKTIASTEGFWLDIINYEYQKGFLFEFEFFGKHILNSDDLIKLAGIFSKLVDATSPFTIAHSKDVAVLASFLAKKHGYNDEEVKMFYLAGLLHDFGKLAIPNCILNKPSKLTTYEYDIIKQHPYYSFRILQQIEGFEQIALWACQHHELLDGQGYPYKLNNQNISLGARIIAVSDVFCALTQDRPYRSKLSILEALDIMDTMSSSLKLDPLIYNTLKQFIDEAIINLENKGSINSEE